MESPRPSGDSRVATVTGSSERCVVCRARSTGLVCGLDARARDRIDQDKTTHPFRRGQFIFFAGTPASALYVVHSGRVKVFRTARNGEEQVLRVLGPGEILGYRPLFANEPYGASAEAIEPSTICILPATTVYELLRDIPTLAPVLLAKLARELRMSEELMMDLRYRPVPQRTARLLLRLLEDNRGVPDPPLLPSHLLRRQDMARMVGTRPETFSRVLRAFAQRGIIALARAHIRIRDEARLREAAGGPLGPDT